MSFDEMGCPYKTFCEISRQQNILEIWENNIKMNFIEIVWTGFTWIRT
jgi:hypothetical protein